MYSITVAYLERYREFPGPTKVIDGVHLGKWLGEQRWRAELGMLSATQTQRINSLDALYAKLNPSSISILLDLASKDEAQVRTKRERPARRRKALQMSDILFRSTDKERTPTEVITERVNAATAFYNANGKLPGKANRDVKAGGQVIDYWLYDVRSALKNGTLTEDAISILAAEPWWTLIQARAFGKKVEAPAAPVAPKETPAAETPAAPEPARPGDIITNSSGGTAGIYIGDGKMINDIGSVVAVSDSTDISADKTVSDEAEQEPSIVADFNGGSSGFTLADGSKVDSLDEAVSASQTGTAGDAEVAEAPSVPERRADGRFRSHSRSKLAEAYRAEHHTEEVTPPQHIAGVTVYKVTVAHTVGVEELENVISRHSSNNGVVVDVSSSNPDLTQVHVEAKYLVINPAKAVRDAQAFGYTAWFKKAGV